MLVWEKRKRSEQEAAGLGIQESITELMSVSPSSRHATIASIGLSRRLSHFRLLHGEQSEEAGILMCRIPDVHIDRSIPSLFLC
jgi:hypothetical protein